MNSFRKVVQYCHKACSNLSCDLKVTGGKVSKEYISERIKQIAATYKRVLMAANKVIVNNLDYIPQFQQVLELINRYENSVRALQTSLVYQSSNNKQRIEIAVLTVKIEEIQKNTSFIRQRIDLLASNWNIDALIQMSKDPIKREQIQEKFREKGAILSQNIVKKQAQPTINKKRCKIKEHSSPEKSETQHTKHESIQELNQEEQLEILSQIGIQPQKKEIKKVVKVEAAQQKQTSKIKEQSTEKSQQIVCIND